MHRTTINLDEAVYLRVKKLAQRKGKSLARTIEDLLRSALGSGATEEVVLPLHRDNGPLPGVDIADRERLYDLMERR
jgi:macrodomain Ter protein organizer (MatP/YcbG family)